VLADDRQRFFAVRRFGHDLMLGVEHRAEPEPKHRLVTTSWAGHEPRQADRCP
jgi:hypothetical protein